MKRKLTLFLFLAVSSIFAQEKSKEVLSEEIIRLKQPSDSAIKEINFINREMESFLHDFEKAIKSYYEVHGNSIGFKYDSKEQFEFIENYILSDKEIIVRQFAAMQIPKLIMNGLRLEEKDSTLKRVCTEIMYPDDIMWTLDKNAILFFGNFYINSILRKYIEKNPIVNEDDSKKRRDEVMVMAVQVGLSYKEAIYKENPSRIVKAQALLSILDMLSAYKEYERGNDYYHILKEEYLDIEGVEESIVQYNPNKNTKIGNKVPRFESTDVRSKDNLSTSSLLGKYYLIQFWSTSCAPCIYEMKELHHLYEKYKDKGFTIVSFDLGDPLDVLNKFWDQKWAMPWYNIQLEEGWKDEIAISFEVRAIPNIVFVGKEGEILENNDSFRNGRLEKVISKYFEKEQTEL